MTTGITIIGEPVEAIATALCATHFDLRPRVLLNAPEMRPSRPVTLSPNATRILHALRLRQPLEDAALVPEHVYFRHWRSGFIFGHRPLGAVAGARHGAPHVLMDDGALAELLRRQARLRGIDVASAGDTVLRIEAGTDGATSRLHVDGHASDMTVLCGAAGRLPSLEDGVSLGALLGAGGRDDWSSARLRRALADGEPEPATPVVDCWLGPGVIVTVWPVLPDGTGGRYRHAAVSAPGRSGEDALTLLRELPRLHPELQPWIDDAETEHRIEHGRVRLPGRWHAPGVAGLGRWLQSTPPELALDEALALEDAWVLCCLLEAWEIDTARAVGDYREARLARRQRAGGAALDWQRWLARPERFGAWRRNLRLAVESRLLPELALQQFDWLYGYNLPGRFY